MGVRLRYCFRWSWQVVIFVVVTMVTAFQARHLMQHTILLRQTTPYGRGPDQKQQSCEQAIHAANVGV